MTIRPVRPRDVKQILALFEAVAAEGLWIGTEPDFNRALYTDFITSASRPTERTVAFVAENQARIILGQITAYRDPLSGTWSLGMLVLKPHRRTGIGSALLTTLIDWAKHTGIPELYLEVFPHNEPALGLYRRFGFIQKAYHKNQLTRRNGERWDTIEMMLSLP